jgi:predicted ATPase
LNIARSLITQPQERSDLTQLNLTAGKKARNATAYIAASNYLQTGIELLPRNCWQTNYQLTLDLYVAATESAYLAGDLERMEEIASIVLRSAQTILDKVEIYRIQLSALTLNGKMLEAIHAGVNALSQLGIEIPTSPDLAKTEQALQALSDRLAGKQIEDLLNLPTMSDRQAQLTMNLLADLCAPIFSASPELAPIVTATMVSLSLQFGNTDLSGLGYINHGVILTAFFGNLEAGCRFSDLALALSDRFNSSELKGKISFLFGAWIQHRRKLLREVIPILKYAYTACIEAGFLNASYGISCYFDANLLSGVELHHWEPEISAYSQELKRMKQYSIQAYLELKQQVAQNLMNPSSQPDDLNGSAYNETLMIPVHFKDGDFTALAYVYIYKLMLAYLFGNYPVALDNVTRSQQYLLSLSGTMPVPVFHFYAALTHLALFADRSELEQIETLVQVDIHQ